MKRLLLLLTTVAALALAPAGLAFIHVTIPADECAPAQAGTPGDNPTASAAIPSPAEGGPARPLGGTKSAPTECPAPTR
jgi:hypothetical protein